MSCFKEAIFPQLKRWAVSGNVSGSKKHYFLADKVVNPCMVPLCASRLCRNLRTSFEPVSWNRKSRWQPDENVEWLKHFTRLQNLGRVSTANNKFQTFLANFRDPLSCLSVIRAVLDLLTDVLGLNHAFSGHWVRDVSSVLSNLTPPRFRNG